MAYAVPVRGDRRGRRAGLLLHEDQDRPAGHPGGDAGVGQGAARRRSTPRSASIETPHTKNGRLPYYFDANGRYEKKETLLRLLDHAREIGAFDQIAIIEEPFPEELEIDVGDIGVRLAADESAHTDADAVRRIEMGYGAIALKPIAKTLSMTLKIAQAAHERGVPCFCADLTVNPILVDWNKNVAARLAPLPRPRSRPAGNQRPPELPELGGDASRYHPVRRRAWTQPRQGLFHLDEDFYARSGGIFLPSPHYEAMFEAHR